MFCPRCDLVVFQLPGSGVHLLHHSGPDWGLVRHHGGQCRGVPGQPVRLLSCLLSCLRLYHHHDINNNHYHDNINNHFHFNLHFHHNHLFFNLHHLHHHHHLDDDDELHHNGQQQHQLYNVEWAGKRHGLRVPLHLQRSDSQQLCRVGLRGAVSWHHLVLHQGKTLS